MSFTIRFGATSWRLCVALAFGVLSCVPPSHDVVREPRPVSLPPATALPSKEKEREKETEPPAVYLATSSVGGSVDCLDPDSKDVRKAMLEPIKLDALVDTRTLAADVAFFRRVFLREYAGAAELLQNPAFDVDDFFAKWQAELLAGPTRSTLREAVADRVVSIKATVGDRHLKIAGLYRFFVDHPELTVGEFQATAPAAKPNVETCRAVEGLPAAIEGTLREAASLEASGARTAVLTVSARGPGPSVLLRCDSGELRLERRTAAAKPVRNPAYEWTKTGDAAVLRIGSLSGDKEAVAKLQMLARDANLHAKQKLIVFDFRGNGGGSDGYVYDWVEHMARGRYATAQGVSGAASRTCGPWNQLVSSQIYDGRVDDADAKEERRKHLDAMRRTGRASSPRIDSSMLTFGAQTPYTGRVFVLIDRRSASSAESSALLLSEALGATIVGERSGGFFEYGEVTPFIMPRTGIVWDVPTKRFYPDQRVEAVGVVVDAYLSTEALSLDAKDLLPVLRKLPPRDTLRSRRSP